ncbi:MAG: flagellar basal body-associated FliL family protein [Alphaproteobacteria bacterium]|nr:flagellar basal body-associated FliL family protein [Alphaproteobacteria bacterium]
MIPNDNDQQPNPQETENEPAALIPSTPSKDHTLLKLLVIFGLIVILIGGSAAAIFLTPLKDKIWPTNDKIKKADDVNLLEVAFLNMPEILVNLKSDKPRGNMLKASFVFELNSPEDKEEVDHVKPLIVDQFQSYLREQEVSDLQGAVGLERLRQELLNRVNTIISPRKIRQVLLKEFLLQ